LTITKPAQTYAGMDASICAGNYFFVSSATASNYTNIYWVTSGSGSFLNGTSIAPTYQPSSTDIIAGAVTLTLHAGSILPCTGEVTDDMILTILPATTALAGGDATICSGTNYTLAAAQASHYSSLNWTTSGSGTFSNPTLLNPIYVPGFSDRIAGSVTLTLSATGIAPCNNVVSDDMILTITPTAIVNAGPNATSCASMFTNNSATASNYSTVSWSTSGTGSFINGNTLSPTYTPSAADLLAGSVVLTLSAMGIAPCNGTVTDEMILTLPANVTVNA